MPHQPLKWGLTKRPEKSPLEQLYHLSKIYLHISF